MTYKKDSDQKTDQIWDTENYQICYFKSDTFLWPRYKHHAAFSPLYKPRHSHIRDDVEAARVSWVIVSGWRGGQLTVVYTAILQSQRRRADNCGAQILHWANSVSIVTIKFRKSNITWAKKVLDIIKELIWLEACF